MGHDQPEGIDVQYASTATIAADPATIWRILTDAPGYASWDNGVERIEGTIGEGEKIRIHSEVQPGRAFPTTVSDLVADRSMTWSGGMPLGLFKGVRTFRLTPDGEHTRFDMREEFTGPLLGMISKRMPDLQPSFDQFAAGLKAEAEQRAAR